MRNNQICKLANLQKKIGTVVKLYSRLCKSLSNGKEAIVARQYYQVPRPEQMNG